MASMKVSFYVLFIILGVAIQLGEFAVEANIGARRALRKVGLNVGCNVVNIGANVPVAGGPVADCPVADGPVADGPVADGPVADGSVAGGHVADGPVAGGPVADGPVAGADDPADGRNYYRFP